MKYQYPKLLLKKQKLFLPQIKNKLTFESLLFYAVDMSVLYQI